jgi:acetyl esterase/lipase
MQAIRQGDLMAVRYDIKTPGDDFEIYNVVRDPKETRNLAAAGNAGLQSQFKNLALQSRRPAASNHRPYDATPVPPSSSSATTAAFTWTLHKGDFPWTPDCATLRPDAAGAAATLADALAAFPPGQPAALRVTTLLHAPADGEYTFALDLGPGTGALLRLHGATLIDATVGTAAAGAHTASIRLQAGPHPLTLTCHHTGAGAPSLSLKWTPPDQPAAADGARPPDAAPSATATQEISEIYKTVGVRELALLVDQPAGWQPGDRRPAIVFFFGGGWKSGNPRQFKPQATHFAKRGMVCLRADYRVRNRDLVLPTECVEDAISAMRHVRARAAALGIDSARIAAAGGSAGGHLAACTALVTDINAASDDTSVSPRPDALILYNPAVDLTAFPGTADKHFIKDLDAAALKRISPLLLANKTLPPTLLMDGTADRLYNQIRAFEEKLVTLGIPVEARYVKNQPHGFFNKSPHLEQTTAMADAFLTRLGWLPAQNQPQD